MAYIEDIRFSSNWHVSYEVVQAMLEHERKGQLNETTYYYIGDSPQISTIVDAFNKSSKQSDIDHVRVYTRINCTDPRSGKYHIISSYQLEHLQSGLKKQVIEATWFPKSKLRLNDLVAEIKDSFSDLVQRNPKYGGKLPTVVGKLHEFQ